MIEVQGKNVFVGLSGGVDSSVSAALLKKAGANVTGVFIRGWYPPGMPCTWSADRRDAMRVAARLQIPFYTLDASAEYKKGVIDYLLAEYKAGRTPNPDVMCNREVKFGAFYRFAKANGAEFIATGHYAQGGAGVGEILRGVDPAKDQSYFLWAVPKEVIADTIFPVGNLPKSKVRALARAFNVPVAQKKDSQGICFLGSVSVEDFLKSEFGSFPGTAVDEKGNTIGEHEGVLLYTLGERVALLKAPTGPWFVQAKDIQHNVLVVSRIRARNGTTPTALSFSDSNWFEEESEVRAAQTRYHGPLAQGMVEGGRFVAHMPLSEPAAAGQSIVFYNGERLIGGGIIS